MNTYCDFSNQELIALATANFINVKVAEAANNELLRRLTPPKQPEIVKLDATTMKGAFVCPKPERIWRDADMRRFGIWCVVLKTSVQETFDAFIEYLKQNPDNE
jgi:hypothetical protein